MRTTHSPAKLFAGIDNLSLGKKEFHPSQEDISRICRFFNIGKLRHYAKEKGITFPHANFFVFVTTTHGKYALKFYPMDAAKKIAIEYAINRILAEQNFPTPAMYTGLRSQPFFTSNGCLAACYSFIDGQSAWNHIKQRNTIRQINGAMLSLKNILSVNTKRLPCLKQASFVTTINTLTRYSRAMAPYDQKETINASLLDACRTYQHHRSLFTRRWLHYDANLTNFLIDKKTVYTLDLEHVGEDYALSDLASLLTSCLLSLPATTIKAIVKDYFTQHQIGPPLIYLPDPRKISNHSLVLNTLVKIGLIKEYIGRTQRERSVNLPTYPPDLVHTYMSCHSKRKESIISVLKKTNVIADVIV